MSSRSSSEKVMVHIVGLLLFVCLSGRTSESGLEAANKHRDERPLFSKRQAHQGWCNLLKLFSEMGFASTMIDAIDWIAIASLYPTAAGRHVHPVPSGNCAPSPFGGSKETCCCQCKVGKGER